MKTVSTLMYFLVPVVYASGVTYAISACEPGQRASTLAIAFLAALMIGGAAMILAIVADWLEEVRK